MEDAVVLLAPLARNIEIFRSRLGAPANADVIIRRFQSGAFESAVVAIDGMISAQRMDENILKPCMNLPDDAGGETAPRERAAYLAENAVSVLCVKMKENIDEIIADVLGGQCALLCEGCAQAAVLDVRGFEKRTIGRPQAEQVVLGAHESFTESIRTNITLLRRIVQREELTTEFVSAGGAMKTRCALLYLRGTADEAALARIRRRLEGCTSGFALTAGAVEQLIEEHPMAIIPQCVRTERPDRAASFLAEGQIVVLTDGSPAALGAPATLLHQLHTPDDASMRWQYGTFLRVVRLLGVLIHVFLPGLYLAVLRFHPELLSPMLLTSVYETGARVPAPSFLEALLMTLAFDLINEAGLRAPGAMGNALGIVSGIILGQSAVSADIVSPLLLIVVAASGLGGFCVPGYALSIGLKIVQLMMLCAGALGGLLAMELLLLALLCALCAMRSIGAPLLAPLAPARPHNPDILLRLPLRFQRARAFFAARKKGDAAQRVHAAYRARAASAGIAVGAQVFLFAAGVCAPLTQGASWLAALVCVPAAALFAAAGRRALLAPCGAFLRALLALTLMLHAAYAAACLCALAEQTLLTQARMTWCAGMIVLFASACMASGGTGVCRLSFALRFALPALLLGFAAAALAGTRVQGLFPLLGAGAGELALSSALMLGAASPALMIALPPPEIMEAGAEAQRVPEAKFFILRVCAGAGVGALLLLLTDMSRAYTDAPLGARLRLLGSAQAREGIVQAALSALELGAAALLLALTLLLAREALAPLLGGRGRAWLPAMLLLALGAALFALVVWGFQAAALAPVVLAPAALFALFAGRRKSP